MRILLINPPVEDFFFTPQRAYPLGLLYLAAPLVQEGFTVKILNAVEGGQKYTIKAPRDFSYLARYYQLNKSPFRLFSHFYHFGLSYEDIAREVKEFQPRIVGISANFSPYFDSVRQTASVIKAIDKRIVVVVGGRFSTAAPRIVLGEKAIDFAVRGEAENSFLNLCRCIERKKFKSIPGVCFRQKNKNHISACVPCIENLDTLLFPARELLDAKKYFFKGMISASLLCSRGCNLHCRFCAISERFRARSAENVLKEVTMCYEQGIRHFNFEDDNINIHPEFEKILDSLIARFHNTIKISFMNGFMSLAMNKGSEEKLYQAGITHLDLSLVTADKRLRKKSARKENARRIFSFTDAMIQKGVVSTVHFIVGLPGQSFKEALSDVLFLAGKNVLLGPSIFYPVIKSGFFDDIQKKFAVSEEDYRFFRSSVAYFDKGMSRDEIFFIFYLSRIVNFVKEFWGGECIKGSDLKKLVKAYAEKWTIKNNILVSRVKIDRMTLGKILLHKIFEEKIVYRVQEIQKENKYQYVFFKEAFVSPGFLISSFSRMKIAALTSGKK